MNAAARHGVPVRWPAPRTTGLTHRWRRAAYKQLIAWLQEGFRRAELQQHVETLMARIAKSLRDVPTIEERDLALLALERLVPCARLTCGFECVLVATDMMVTGQLITNW